MVVPRAQRHLAGRGARYRQRRGIAPLSVGGSMTLRLPPQPGEWIDRSTTVNFTFEGQAYTGYAGDSVTSALWGAGERVLGRSFKYHRPRGVMSLANHE